MHTIDFSDEAVAYMNLAYVLSSNATVFMNRAIHGECPGPWNRPRPRELAQTGGNDPGPWNGIQVHPSLAAHQDMR